MAIKIEADDAATGVGYWMSTVFNARDILEQVAEEFDGYLDASPPEYVYESTVYKVTITVEKV